MPTGIDCPHCGRRGTVVLEIVVTSDRVERHYECRACAYVWRLTDYDGVRGRSDA